MNMHRTAEAYKIRSTFGTLIGQLYQIAAQSDSHTALLESICETFGAALSYTETWDGETHTFERKWACHPHESSPNLLPEEWNTCVTLHQHIASPPPEKRRFAFRLGLLRSYQQAPFSKEERTTLEALAPHLEGICQMQQRVHQLRSTNLAFLDTLSRLGYGILVLDAEGTVVQTNQAATHTLSAQDGLSQTRRRLILHNRTQHKQLQAVLQQTPNDNSETILRIPRPSCKREYVCYLSPLANPERDQPALFIMFLLDPAQVHNVDPRSFQQMFRLTQAEAEIASLYIHGTQPKEIAQQRGVSLSTVRHQTKQLFQKTQTNSQNELIALLLRSLVPPFLSHHMP
jgi:DNA-binding CsgD family transcriptional regulator